MSESNARTPLISGVTLILIAVGVAAWSSNPDDRSFRRYAERTAAQDADGALEHIASKALPVEHLQRDLGRNGLG